MNVRRVPLLLPLLLTACWEQASTFRNAKAVDIRLSSLAVHLRRSDQGAEGPVSVERLSTSPVPALPSCEPLPTIAPC